MNFQQLRSVREAVRQGYNLTLVAEALHTSQPGVSRQLKELEDELGVALFVRSGRRFQGLTPPGQVMLPIIERLLQEADNLKGAGEEFAQSDRGLLSVAAAHTQARYALPRLAQFPLITYESGYTGRSHIDDAFHREGLKADIVLQAMDADVIKTYVDLGIGVGVIASVAFDEVRDAHLMALDARHLFATNTTRVAIKRGAYQRGYVYDFIHTFVPTLTREVVQRAMSGAPGDAVSP